MWTEEHRRIYRREGDGYPSDLRDAEWARLEPMIPPARPGGRPRKTDMRAAINAILYLLRTGCPGAICRVTAFRRARRSTTSFASSSEMGSGRRSGPSCTWPCVNVWDARPAHRLRFSTVNRSNRQKKGRQGRQGGLRRRQEGEASQDPRPSRQRRAADALSIRLRSRSRYAAASHGSN